MKLRIFVAAVLIFAAAVAGRELTPFLLSHLAARTGGATLRANVALLENNARLAADIAREVMSD